MKKVIYILIFLLGILIDQLIKMCMINVNIEIIKGIIRFSYRENIGMAFSIGNIPIALIISIVLILIIVIYIIKYNKSITNYIPYILVLIGGISNLIDRIFRGFVIDYIDVSLFNFPVFNLADMFIVSGVIWIVAELILKIAFKKDTV